MSGSLPTNNLPAVNGLSYEPPLTGYGGLAVTTSSVAIGTMTPGPNSPAIAFPLAGKILTVKNSSGSAGNVFICPLGGTASSSNGLPLAPGAQWRFNLGTSSVVPTIVSDSTASVSFTW